MAEPVLNFQWITEHPLDAECKRYLVLAYVQNIQKKFSSEILFPHLSDLIAHIRHLDTISEGFKILQSDFPKELTGFHTKTLSAVYSKKIDEEHIFSFVHELIEFAKPRLSETASTGTGIIEEVENHLQWQTIGLLPVIRDEGYLILSIDGISKVNVFRYALSSLSLASEKSRALSMNWVMSDTLSLSNSPQSIKLNLIRKFPDLPNPATFFCTSLKTWPMEETLLPVTKGFLNRMLS